MSSVNAHERRFADRMASIRKLRNLNQSELAAACGVRRHVITGIEAGRRGIRLGEAVTLCGVLGVELAAMVSAAPMALSISMPVD